MCKSMVMTCYNVFHYIFNNIAACVFNHDLEGWNAFSKDPRCWIMSINALPSRRGIVGERTGFLVSYDFGISLL